MLEASKSIAHLGFRPYESLFLSFLSDGQRQAGDAPAAIASARTALSIAYETPSHFEEAWARRAHGRALAALGEVEASEELARAARLFTMIGARREAARCAEDYREGREG